MYELKYITLVNIIITNKSLLLLDYMGVAVNSIGQFHETIPIKKSISIPIDSRIGIEGQYQNEIDPMPVW